MTGLESFLPFLSADSGGVRKSPPVTVWVDHKETLGSFQGETLAGLWGTLLPLSLVFRTMDVGAPKDFGIKFLNLECEFLRHEMCSECGFLCLTQMTLGGTTLWNSA